MTEIMLALSEWQHVNNARFLLSFKSVLTKVALSEKNEDSINHNAASS